MILFIILPTNYSAIAGQYPDIPIGKLLTIQEQKEIGLSKLSKKEKEKLRIIIIETYIRGFEKGKKEEMKSTFKHTKRQITLPSVIESQIDGDFEGWEGETIIKLMNGQIWQQSEYYYHYHYSFMPKVLIYKSGGRYMMKVEGIEKAVGVELLTY